MISHTQRLDGMPVEGVEIRFELSATGPIQFLVVEESTGLPSFPGWSTQPEPGTTQSPGEFYQGSPSDSTAIYRLFEIPGSGGEQQGSTMRSPRQILLHPGVT
jgi:hypothetical protein